MLYVSRHKTDMPTATAMLVVVGFWLIKRKGCQFQGLPKHDTLTARLSLGTKLLQQGPNCIISVALWQPIRKHTTTIDLIHAQPAIPKLLTYSSQ